MKSSKSSHSFKSFRDLEVLVKNKSLPPRREVVPKKVEIVQSPELEEKLFKKAMEGVKPIQKDKYVGRNVHIDLPETTRNREDAETLEKLVNLVRYGTGFTVSDTPEYIEGTGYNVPPSIAKRLHRGDFSIQAHIDLQACVLMTQRRPLKNSGLGGDDREKRRFNRPRSRSFLSFGTCP
jgi:hypothetical protein